VVILSRLHDDIVIGAAITVMSSYILDCMDTMQYFGFMWDNNITTVILQSLMMYEEQAKIPRFLPHTETILFTCRLQNQKNFPW